MRDQLSIEAYRDLGKAALTAKQDAVFDLLLTKGPLSNREISEALGWPINTVTPRVKELRDQGFVASAGIQKVDATHRWEHVWEVST